MPQPRFHRPDPAAQIYILKCSNDTLKKAPTTDLQESLLMQTTGVLWTRDESKFFCFQIWISYIWFTGTRYRKVLCFPVYEHTPTALVLRNAFFALSTPASNPTSSVPFSHHTPLPLTSSCTWSCKLHGRLRFFLVFQVIVMRIF